VRWYSNLIMFLKWHWFEQKYFFFFHNHFCHWLKFCNSQLIIDHQIKGSNHRISDCWKWENSTSSKYLKVGQKIKSHELKYNNCMATHIFNNHIRGCHRYIGNPSNFLNFNGVTKTLLVQSFDDMECDLNSITLVVI
jgi:hypothetical protein